MIYQTLYIIYNKLNKNTQHTHHIHVISPVLGKNARVAYHNKESLPQMQGCEEIREGPLENALARRDKYADAPWQCDVGFRKMIEVNLLVAR